MSIVVMRESDFYSTENALEKTGIHIELNDNVLIINEAFERDVSIEDSNWGFSL
jgi:hypothetical protein